jgi:hypothetical protein
LSSVDFLLLQSALVMQITTKLKGYEKVLAEPELMGVKYFPAA